METIDMTMKYAGAMIEVTLYPEMNFIGTIYPVEINGNYLFTLYLNEDEDWAIMRESNGLTPLVENELFDMILKKLEYELKYAA